MTRAECSVTISEGDGSDLKRKPGMLAKTKDNTAVMPIQPISTEENAVMTMHDVVKHRTIEVLVG